MRYLLVAIFLLTSSACSAEYTINSFDDNSSLGLYKLAQFVCDACHKKIESDYGALKISFKTLNRQYCMECWAMGIDWAIKQALLEEKQ